MLPTYAVLGWNSTQVQIGSLTGNNLELRPVASIPLLEDIRNSSSASEKPWGAVTAVNPLTLRQALFHFALHSNSAEMLVEEDYILYNVIDPTGQYIYYTAPPSLTGAEMSLYVYYLETSRTSLLIPSAISRACIPSVNTSQKVIYHTTDRQIVQFDAQTRNTETLFNGEYPTFSVNGLKIAYRVENSICIWNAEDRRSKEVPLKRWFWEGYLRGGMSWSPDERFLLVGQSAGIFGNQLNFYRIDVVTGERLKIQRTFLRGLQFM